MRNANACIQIQTRLRSGERKGGWGGLLDRICTSKVKPELRKKKRSKVAKYGMCESEKKINNIMIISGVNM